MSPSRMAVKTFLRGAMQAGIWGSKGGSLSSRNPSSLYRPASAVRSTGPATLYTSRSSSSSAEAERSWARKPSSARSEISSRTGSPHFRCRRVSWIVESRLLLTSFSWIDRSLLRVAEGHPLDDPVAAEEGVEPGADHILEQDEAALGIALVRQWNQPVDHRGYLEH